MSRGAASRAAFGVRLGLPAGNAKTLARLSTPEKIQDFITGMVMNFERRGDTCRSVVNALRSGEAHCIEAAFIAAAALWMAGRPPLLMDLRAEGDHDHVVALFRAGKFWGAISKSNHVWLRWRDPVYSSLRELAMSYFHEYSNKGRKTLRAYSVPFDLRKWKPGEWVTNEGNCWDVAAALDDARHYNLVSKSQSRVLRPLDKMERRADMLLEYTGRKVL